MRCKQGTLYFYCVCLYSKSRIPVQAIAATVVTHPARWYTPGSKGQSLFKSPSFTLALLSLPWASFCTTKGEVNKPTQGLPRLSPLEAPDQIYWHPLAPLSHQGCDWKYKSQCPASPCLSPHCCLFRECLSAIPLVTCCYLSYCCTSPLPPRPLHPRSEVVILLT